jgi:MFS family permease
MNRYIEALHLFSRNAKLMLTTHLFDGFSYGILVVILNLYLLAGGFQEDFIGLVQSIIMFSMAFMSFPAGIVSDHIGRKKSIMLGYTLNFISIIGVALTIVPEIIIAFRILHGIGLSFILVSLFPFLTENSTSKERIHLFSIDTAIYSGAIMAGNFLGGWLPTIFGSVLSVTEESLEAYRSSLLISAVILSMCLLPLYLIREKKSDTVLHRNPFKNLVSTDFIIKFMIISVFVGIIYGLISPFYNVFFKNQLLASTEQIGTLYSLSEVAAVFAVVFSPFIVGVLGKVKSVTFLQILMVPFIMMMVLSYNIYMVGIAFLIKISLESLTSPIYSNFVMERLKEQERASVNGMRNMIQNLAWGVASIAAGILMARGMYSTPFFITSVLIVIGFSLFYIFFRKEEEVAADGGE